MSALPAKGDLTRTRQEDRYDPTRTCNELPSFDHLGGLGQNRLRDSEAQRLRGLEVDDEIEFRRLLDWKIGRLLALQDAADVDARLTIHVQEVGPVANQAARQDEVAKPVACRNCMLRGQRHQPGAPAREEGVVAD